MNKKVIIIVAAVAVVVAALIVMGVLFTDSEDILEAGTYTSEDGSVTVTVEKSGDTFKVESDDIEYTGTLEFKKFGMIYATNRDDFTRDVYTLKTDKGEIEVLAYIIEGEKSIMFSTEDDSIQCFLEK